MASVTTISISFPHFLFLISHFLVPSFISTRVFNIPYSRKYWRSINLAVWPPRRYVVILAEFKFGGLSTTSHRRLCIANILAVLKRIAKPPNLNHRQIFRLYGIACCSRSPLPSTKLDLGFAYSTKRQSRK